jgi:hypothetical protein
MKEIARRDFLKLGAAGLAVASLGSSVTLGPLARKAGAVVVGATYFDAETMSFPAGVGISIVDDRSANFGKVLSFQNRATAVKNRQNFSGEGSIVRIKARASQNSIGGWPVAAVLVDGREVARWSINTTSFQMYGANVSPSVSAGAHNVSLRAVEGTTGPGTLYVDFVHFQREDAPAPPTSANQIMHGAYSNGRGGNANAQWDTAYNIDRYAALVGKSPLMVLAFQSLNVTPPPQGIIGVLNKYPHFCLTCCPEVTLDGIINGSQDARIDAWANACRNVGRVFYIRLMHEMNGDWYIYSYSKVSDGVNKYKQAFRRVVDRFRAAGATNVKWVFCPNTRSGSGAWSDPTPFANLYPGDSYVDVLGWDGYVNGGSHVDFSRVQGPAAQEMTALNPNKPQWLAEWGYDGLAGQKELYFQQAKAALQSADYSRVKCSNYFDSNQEGRNWAVNSPLAALDDYRALINDPVYQGTSLL